MPHRRVPLSLLPSARRGFTLLEMLVVIVLAGILISVVSISVSQDPKQKLTREAQRIGQLMVLASDEARIRQVPIVWEADLRGYRFFAEVAGERQPLAGDDMLRDRTWETPLNRLAVQDGAGPQPAQVLLGPGAPPVRMAIAREWVQPRWKLELSNEEATVRLEFDEAGRATVLQ